mgnify:CR=1 FL=1
MDDDSESIITNERYEYIASIIGGCLKKKHAGADTISDKIDRIVTNRILALPIFAVIMFIVYYVSVTTVGGIATDWANNGVFGDGWHLFGIGTAAYEEAEHAAKFAELLGEVVTDSTKKNLEMRVEAENGATAGKFDLAKRAKAANLDAIHDTVHEMARDEARHGKAFEGLLKRYFG